jgi:hypothetical protein
MDQLGHTHAAFMLRVCTATECVATRQPGTRCANLVGGADSQHPAAPWCGAVRGCARRPRGGEKNPATSGAPCDGRAWVRTRDLSRVKRAGRPAKLPGPAGATSDHPRFGRRSDVCGCACMYTGSGTRIGVVALHELAPRSRRPVSAARSDGQPLPRVRAFDRSRRSGRTPHAMELHGRGTVIASR